MIYVLTTYQWHLQRIPYHCAHMCYDHECRDPQHTVLGFSWGSADEKKMQKSFGLGRQQLFGRFLDLQLVSQGLGYQQMGLTKLTERVLGCPNHKSKKVVPPS